MPAAALRARGSSGAPDATRASNRCLSIGGCSRTLVLTRRRPSPTTDIPSDLAPEQPREQPAEPRPRQEPSMTPTDPETGSALTERQQRIMEAIRSSLANRGYPPTMREIGDVVGLASPSSVKYQLQVLEEKGYLRRDPISTRAIEIVAPDDDVALATAGEPDGRHLTLHDGGVDGGHALVRAPGRPDRGRWAAAGRAGCRGRVPAPSPAGRRRRSCSCSRSWASR